MSEYAVLALQKGVPGAIAGGIAGFLLGAAACVVNMVYGTPPEQFTYMYKGKAKAYRRLDSLADMKVEEDLLTLSRFRYHNPEAFDTGARLVQHIIDANDSFYVERSKKRDGLKALARLQHAAKKADTRFRTLYFCVKDAGDTAGAEEAEAVIGALHVSFETLSGRARSEFMLNEQLQSKYA